MERPFLSMMVGTSLWTLIKRRDLRFIILIVNIGVYCWKDVKSFLFEGLEKENFKRNSFGPKIGNNYNWMDLVEFSGAQNTFLQKIIGQRVDVASRVTWKRGTNITKRFQGWFSFKDHPTIELVLSLWKKCELETQFWVTTEMVGVFRVRK